MVTSLSQFIFLLLTAFLYLGISMLSGALLELVSLYSSLSKPFAYTFRSDTLTATTPFVTFEYQWAQIAKIVESKNEFFVYSKGSTMQMVLKSAIPPEQLDPLRHLLRDALGDRAKL